LVGKSGVSVRRISDSEEEEPTANLIWLFLAERGRRKTTVRLGEKARQYGTGRVDRDATQSPHAHTRTSSLN
jgi:hypothetical protein